MDDLIEFIIAWLIIVGGYTLLLFTIRLLEWITDMILFGG